MISDEHYCEACGAKATGSAVYCYQCGVALHRPGPSPPPRSDSRLLLVLVVVGIAGGVAYGVMQRALAPDPSRATTPERGTIQATPRVTSNSTVNPTSTARWDDYCAASSPLLRDRVRRDFPGYVCDLAGPVMACIQRGATYSPVTHTLTLAFTREANRACINGVVIDSTHVESDRGGGAIALQLAQEIDATMDYDAQVSGMSPHSDKDVGEFLAFFAEQRAQWGDAYAALQIDKGIQCSAGVQRACDYQPRRR